MINRNTFEKLQILTESAKYDVSCASSGVSSKNNVAIGNKASFGICHSWSEDGRCISLLKTLLTNDCIFDCSYCVNRYSNDIKRASFTPEEIATLTIEFYKRNYIEGLFLSSAIEKNPDATMEKIIHTLLILRKREKFGGYIHVKAIPGADPLLIRKAGNLADRMSINVELPSKESLKKLAPQKNVKKIFLPMAQISREIKEFRQEQKKYKYINKFVPAGQTTQIIVGATAESDKTILTAAENMYKLFNLKRVYYSAYVPVNEDKNLPSLNISPPLLREHRLYQADWLLRYYKFKVSELLTERQENFDLNFDPKLNWALNNIHLFPIEVQTADYKKLLRIPGIGVKSAQRIIKQRKVMRLKLDDLKKMGVVVKRAKYFLLCNGKFYGVKNMDPEIIKALLNPVTKYEQLSLV